MSQVNSHLCKCFAPCLSALASSLWMHSPQWGAKPLSFPLSQSCGTDPPKNLLHFCRFETRKSIWHDETLIKCRAEVRVVNPPVGLSAFVEVRFYDDRSAAVRLYGDQQTFVLFLAQSEKAKAQKRQMSHSLALKWNTLLTLLKFINKMCHIQYIPHLFT